MAQAGGMKQRRAEAAFHAGRFILAALILAVCGATIRGQNPAPESYAPQPVSAPRSAPYLLPDGSIYVAGNDLAASFLEKIDAIFMKDHPGIHLHMDSTSSEESIAAVISGKSAFGVTARDVTWVDKAAFRSLYGYAVTDIQFGWDNTPDAAHFPPNGKFPPTVWVNARNPVSALTLDQLRSILLTGSKAGDITRWSQISFDEGPLAKNGGDYAKREIHVYLPLLHGLPVLATDRTRLGHGLQWTPRAEYLPFMEDVVNAVANDPFGIGMTGWFPGDEGWDRQVELGSKVRLLPLSKDADSRISHGGPGDLYPMSGGLHILINQAPGRPVAAWLKEYVRLMLSQQGQAILASMTATDGFIPMSEKEAAEQFHKLQ